MRLGSVDSLCVTPPLGVFTKCYPLVILVRGVQLVKRVGGNTS